MSAGDQGHGATARRSPAYLLDVSAAVRRPFGAAWMITFTDLVALMLTFFVMLFAMSQVQHSKWQGLVRSLAGSMDSIQSRDGAKPAIAFQIDQDTPLPGTDLDYLGPVIMRQIASEPLLEGGVVRRLQDRIVVSLPADRFFDPGASSLAARASPTVYAIGSVLRTLDNVIEIHGHVAGAGGKDPTAAGWRRSLARAAALVHGLAEVGYDGPILARGYGDARLGEERHDAFDNRIDIVIREHAREDS